VGATTPCTGRSRGRSTIPEATKQAKSLGAPPDEVLAKLHFSRAGDRLPEHVRLRAEERFAAAFTLWPLPVAGRLFLSTSHGTQMSWCPPRSSS
jgi:hypothetical protein